MRQFFVMIYLLFLAGMGRGQELPGASPFYIGHSLVNFTMPAMVHELAVDGGKVTHYDQQIINGATLWSNYDNHASAQGTPYITAFPDGGHDVLIVTEAVPLQNHLDWSHTYRYADSLFRYALNNNAGDPLRYFIYETWHCINTGISECDHDEGDTLLWQPRLVHDLPLWTGIVDSVRDQFPGEEVCMVPAGQAFYDLSAQIDAGNLPEIASFTELFSDDIHLTNKGNYFVACVMYACIFRASPEGLTHLIYDEWGNLLNDLPTQEQAAVMQQVAWETVVQMQDYSCVNAVSTYAGSGSSISPGAFVYPNPARDYLILSCDGDAPESVICDFTGRILKRQTGHMIDISGLSAGTYLLITENQVLRFTKM